jgi:hypothetical protein
MKTRSAMIEVPLADVSESYFAWCLVLFKRNSELVLHSVFLILPEPQRVQIEQQGPL